MASKLSPATPRSKLQRGSGLETDRTPPSGKTSSGMFGDNSPKAQKRTPVSRGTELNQVQEELAKTKEQLALMEKSKANLLQDLARSKRQVEDLTAKLQDVAESSKKERIRAEEMEHASFTAAEDWQVEVEAMRDQYEAAILELEANKQTMDSLKHELIMSVEAKNEAVRLAGEAMNAAESTAKRVEDLSAELLAARRSIVAVDSASTKSDEVKDEVSSPEEDIAGATAPCDESAQESAALLLAAKEAELSKALQEANSARSELEGLKRDLAWAQESQTELLDLSSTLELFQTELKISKDAEMKSELQLHSLSSDLDRAINELADSKEVERSLKSQLTEMSAALVRIKLELADAKQAEEEASVAARNACANYDKASAVIEKARESESATLASLAKVSTELEEAQEKLSRVALEGAMVVTFLETVKAELGRSQAEIATLEKKEASASLKAETLSLELAKVTEAHQGEAKLLNERVTSANAAMESLRLESETVIAELGRSQAELATLEKKEASASLKAQTLSLELTKVTEDHQREAKLLNERVTSSNAAMEALRLESEKQRLELAGFVEKESLVNMKLEALAIELKQTQEKVIDLQRQELSASERGAALSRELDNSQKELSAVKERELSMTYKVGTLTDELEAKQLEVLELRSQAESAADEAAALRVSLEKSQSEVARLKEIELSMNSKAAALSVALASLSETTESRLLQLKEKEEIANVKAVALHEELRRISSEFENAITAAKVAREDANKLYESLQLAKSEKDQARQEKEMASIEAAKNKEGLVVALAEAQTARDELQKALEAVNAAEQKAREGAREAKFFEESMQAAQKEVLLVKSETEAVREELQAALVDAQRTRKELDQERQEAQSVREDILALKDEVLTVKGEAKTATEEAEAVKQELGKLRGLIDRAKSGEEEALSACRTAESRLQDALLELEALKLQKEADQERLEAQSLGEEILALKAEVLTVKGQAKSATEEAEALKAEVLIVKKQAKSATEEAEALKAEVLTVKGQAMSATEEAEALKAEVLTVKGQAKSAKEEAEAVNQELDKLRGLVDMAKSVEEEAQSARKTVESRLQDALLELEALKMQMEVDQERKEAQSEGEEVLALQAEVHTLKGQAMIATEDAEAVKQELGKIRGLVDMAKAGEEEAQLARKTAESRLQDALLELEALKLHATSVQDEEKQQSEALSKATADVAILQEEVASLTLRLQDTQSHLAAVTAELGASIAKTEKLSKELEALKLEKEANEMEVLEVHRLLEDTEMAKANMEAEIQRLLDESKQWQTAKDAIDIPVDLEVNGRDFSLECREDKPQPDCVEEISNLASPPVNLNEKEEKEETLKWEETVVNGEGGSKEELAGLSVKKVESPDGGDEGIPKEEVASQDESPSLPLKKKKKNLLGRLGTLLDKKKHSQQQTP